MNITEIRKPLVLILILLSIALSAIAQGEAESVVGPAAQYGHMRTEASLANEGVPASFSADTRDQFSEGEDTSRNDQPSGVLKFIAVVIVALGIRGLAKI